MSEFLCLVEHNSWEGETYRHYFDMELFQEEIQLMDDFINKTHKKECRSYEFDVRQTLSRDEVEQRLKRGGSGYMAYHNLAIGFRTLPGEKDKNGELRDPFYKGNGIRTGTWDTLAVARRWKMARPGRKLPPLLVPRYGWAMQIHSNGKPTDAWLTLGKDLYSFDSNMDRTEMLVGMELLEPSTGRLMRAIHVEHGGSEHMLRYVQKIPIGGHYTNPDGSSRFEPSENLSYVCFDEVYRLPGLAITEKREAPMKDEGPSAR